MSANTSDFNNIKQWLEPKLDQMGLSVEKFANKVGITKGAMYFYLNDTNRPSENLMIKMCQVLGVPPEEGLAQYTPKRNGRPPGQGGNAPAVRARKR